MGDALAALIAGFGQRPYSTTTRECAAEACGSRVLGFALFCPDCWRLLPGDLQGLISRYHKPRRKPTKALISWVQKAIDELAYIHANGGRAPAPQSFAWDAEPAAPAAVEPSLFASSSTSDDERPA